MMCGCLMAHSQDVKTTFQTSGQWKPLTDVRADAVMVYGTGSRPGLRSVNEWRLGVRKGMLLIS